MSKELENRQIENFDPTIYESQLELNIAIVEMVSGKKGR
jgi:hypothetical protein